MSKRSVQLVAIISIPQIGPIGMDDPETGYMGEIVTPYP